MNESAMCLAKSAGVSSPYMSTTPDSHRSNNNNPLLELCRDVDLLVVLPTGGSGKSFLFELHPTVEANRMTVVFFPLIVLLLQFGRNIEAPPHGLKIQTWVVGKEARPDTNFLFVSAVHAGHHKAFREFLYLMHHQNRLARLCFEEAHCFYQQSFRSVLNLPWLSEWEASVCAFANLLFRIKAAG